MSVPDSSTCISETKKQRKYKNAGCKYLSINLSYFTTNVGFNPFLYWRYCRDIFIYVLNVLPFIFSDHFICDFLVGSQNRKILFCGWVSNKEKLVVLFLSACVSNKNSR